jgi:exodeoxyribonuclease VII small subunit
VARKTKAESKPTEPAPTANFEQSIQRLAAIVEELEGGELPLEQSLELFEEGMLLARASQQTLDRAERKVEQLLGFDDNGDPITVDVDADVDVDD